MTTNSAQLLRLLEPSVRPAFGQSATTANRNATPLDQQSFAQLLDAASDGKIHSGRQIELSCELNPPLSASQMERLANAADMAEAAGARTAMMMIDGRGFVMDVKNRAITTEMNGSNTPMTPVDLAMNVSKDGAAVSSRPLPPPGGGIVPASISRLLTNALSAKPQAA